MGLNETIEKIMAQESERPVWDVFTDALHDTESLATSQQSTTLDHLLQVLDNYKRKPADWSDAFIEGSLRDFQSKLTDWSYLFNCKVKPWVPDSLSKPTEWPYSLLGSSVRDLYRS